ncbi:MAG: histidinol-phosphatase HisJ family protein [Coriobacteriales bacterium]|jgi:histidinol-phosphatase (PHP family)|nr:histidinol-phosphatase HisJ family protein [Coriobacteriales bacterium]
MERTDTHTHTYLSNHGIGTVDEVVQSALSQGMTMVALTEHLPLPPGIDESGTFAMDADMLGVYLEYLEAARQTYPSIEIIYGVEVDWRYAAANFILEHSKPFELLLGSVHMLTSAGGQQWQFDHESGLAGWQERGEQNVWDAYLELWLEALASPVPFDIMAHPDLPKKLGFKPKFDTRELYATMAEAAAAAGVMVEVNTSGLHKPVGELYPAPALLRAFCQAGVPCTIGSDAHCPADVGRDFEKGYAALRKAGYRYLTVPTAGGDRRRIPLN